MIQWFYDNIKYYKVKFSTFNLKSERVFFLFSGYGVQDSSQVTSAWLDSVLFLLIQCGIGAGCMPCEPRPDPRNLAYARSILQEAYRRCRVLSLIHIWHSLLVSSWFDDLRLDGIKVVCFSQFTHPCITSTIHDDRRSTPCSRLSGTNGR